MTLEECIDDTQKRYPVVLAYLAGKECPHCAAGLKVVKTKRHWVHWTLKDGVTVCKRVS